MAGIDENLDADLEKKPFSIKDIPGNMLHALSGCIFPLIPILIPAGLMLLLGSVLGPNLLNLLPADHDLIVLFIFVGNAGMYFMPVFAAWSAAKYFNTSAPVAMFLGAVLIHPTLMQIVADQTPFTVYGTPMTPVTYSKSVPPVHRIRSGTVLRMVSACIFRSHCVGGVSSPVHDYDHAPHQPVRDRTSG